MPCAPACFSRGMMVRTVVSSRIVFTASHSSSLKCEMVGFFNAGSTPSTAFEVFLVHVQHQPDFAERVDRAFEQHPDVFQLLRFHASFHGGLLAISWVFDSSTVSMILSLLARSEEPVSVTSTMASARPAASLRWRPN